MEVHAVTVEPASDKGCSSIRHAVQAVGMSHRWETVQLRLEPASVRRIESLATRYGLTVSVVARLAIEYGIDWAERELKRQARQAS